ncbi:MAG: serine hydrolase [Ectothiorhodospiraceae bacterium]|nr:serine hydrolase [Chromatiales bacterium]MCP5156015.1 serine hydrolase [Ectothiorhodospiraceae bacterium]
MHKILATAALALTAATTTHAYPIFGSEGTGIERLEYERRVHAGTIQGRERVSGELRALADVRLRLLDRPDMELPAPDAALGARLVGLLGDGASRYSLTVLDLTDPTNPRYGEHNAGEARNPGSVGKIVVAAAIFQALADAWPGDDARREQVLRDTIIEADDFILVDSHTVRFFKPGDGRLLRRPLQVGDTGNLWQWLDWMLSASSNAAAAVMMREAMLIAHYGKDYPPPRAEAIRFFAETPRQTLSDLLRRTMDTPLVRAGLDVEALRQGSFFTRTGKRKVSGTSSYATARELARYLLRLEQGRIVDRFSSLEIKRLLYMTERRIRYASSPALRDAAVYFKSGSLYQCVPEAGFTCKKYHGNKMNLMNSIAIVEETDPAGGPELHYLATLTSNVLKRNSAVDHQTLATRIHRLLEAEHGIARQ